MNKDIKSLLLYSQEELYNELLVEFDTYTSRDGFDYIILDKEPSINKPMLCVHLDTINTHHNDIRESDVAKEDNIIKLSDDATCSCLGGDDRAGVWIALKLIDWMEDNEVYPYSIGFFKDEEIGCNGSSRLRYYDTASCYIGLDRRGNSDVAIYGYDNQELMDIFIDGGYCVANGSVTDASELSSNDGKACVNLSVGYMNEHTKSEYLDTYGMMSTLKFLKENYEKFTKEEYLTEDTYGYPEEDDYRDEWELLQKIEKLEARIDELEEILEYNCITYADMEKYYD